MKAFLRSLARKGLVPKLVHVTHLPFLGVSLEIFSIIFSFDIHQLLFEKKNCFAKSVSK